MVKIVEYPLDLIPDGHEYESRARRLQKTFLRCSQVSSKNETFSSNYFKDGITSNYVRGHMKRVIIMMI